MDEVRATQLRSFPTAFALVFVMVALSLRSPWLACAAMVPTLLPVVVTLGAMGWLGMNLDIGRAMVAAIVIGIAVEDSIHLLWEYRGQRGRLRHHEAMRAAIALCGRAIVTTSLALAVGFLTLTVSAWQTISGFGLSVSIAVAVALIATLLVLPAVSFAVAGRDPAGRPKDVAGAPGTPTGGVPPIG